MDLSKKSASFDGTALKIDLSGIGNLRFKFKIEKKWVEELYETD